jgi:putative ATP-dependent endonuclease of OLD family
MFVKKVNVKNFRCFDKRGVSAIFDKGVNAIIGENNVGKSAFVDAMRIALSTLTYQKEIFFRKSDFHVDESGKVAETVQIDMYLMDVPMFLIPLINPLKPGEGEFHVRFFLKKDKMGEDRIKYDIWGSDQEDNLLESETLQSFRVAYMGALRDVENGMKPSRDSRMADLLTSVSSTEQQKDLLVDILKKANHELLDQPQVSRMKTILNDNLLGLEQEMMAQQISLGLVDPKFSSIAAALRIWFRPKWRFFDTTTEIFFLRTKTLRP